MSDDATHPTRAAVEGHPSYGMSSRRVMPYCTGCDAPIEAINGSVMLGWANHVAEVAVEAIRRGAGA